jgi:hypothetical protein
MMQRRGGGGGNNGDKGAHVTTEESEPSAKQNYIDIQQLVSNLSHHRLINLKENIKDVIGLELEKTLNTTKGKLYNYKGELPSEMQITIDKDDMVLIDKALRDLLFFDKDLYMKTIIK